MITDKDRLKWLAKHVSYLEHSDMYGVPAIKQPPNRGYWPISDEEEDQMELDEYIDMMIDEEDAVPKHPPF